MNNFSPLLKNKKTLILIGFALLLIVGAVVIGATISHPQTNTENLTTQQNTNNNTQGTQIGNSSNNYPTHITETPTEITARQTAIPIQNISEFAIKDWILSDNDVYTFQYPTDWNLQRTLFQGGQTIVLIPNNSQITPSTPTWSITITKTDTNNPISNKEKLYESLGFKPDSTNISGQTAKSLSGTFPPNATAANAVQETTIYLAKNDYSYVISYKYPGNITNRQYEQLFQKITSTISIEY